MFENLKNLFLNKKNENEPYLFCDEINERLHFFNRKITYCSIGNTSNSRLYPTVVDDFNGQELDYKKLLNKIKADKESFRQGKILESCKNCQRLKKDNWGSKRTPFKLVQFSDWSLCNSECIYCNSWKNTTIKDDKYVTINGAPDTYPIIPIIENMIKIGLITKDTSVNFAGGEPTLYFQFSEAINLLLDYGTKNMEVYSNVINYSKEIEKGISLGVIKLTVSIDAGSKEVHEMVKGVKSYDKVWENLSNYVKAATPDFKSNITSKFVMVPGINDSFEEIEKWINKSKSIGIEKLILNADNRIHEESALSDDLLKKLNELTGFFIELAKKYDLNYELGPNITCFYNK